MGIVQKCHPLSLRSIPISRAVTPAQREARISRSGRRDYGLGLARNEGHEFQSLCEGRGRVQSSSGNDRHCESSVQSKVNVQLRTAGGKKNPSQQEQTTCPNHENCDLME